MESASEEEPRDSASAAPKGIENWASTMLATARLRSAGSPTSPMPPLSTPQSIRVTPSTRPPSLR